MSEAPITLFDANHTSKRRCGGCTACCKILPVQALNKPGWTRCQHQRVGKGCMVYHIGQMPAECHLWSCRWLTAPDTAGLQRPDRSHYVIDPMPDIITAVEDGTPREHMVMQVWLDPAFPDAHKDRALRAYIEMVAERDGMATIIRLGTGRALLIAAPCLCKDGNWMEFAVNINQTGGSGNRFVDRLKGHADA